MGGENPALKETMKTTCPNCGTSHDIGDGKIIGYIENSDRLMTKVKKLVAQINRAKAVNNTSPERRSEIARTAAQKRWEKRGRPETSE